ncbi:MAG: 1-(5-phosphoribosyl)-5-((5-phosphoribosylamino)methylideneamino)imidazole-4-carboxamide isomerase [Spirochaetales bacterium]|nr:1-(5-phosphoribosyl)-5-((5-phosphoribosylamino)methylideneamino)imidazole-4-carboxamide isomerase [Spirochaetales bacterium]
MIVIPSIDILNGSCVRLYQGDYEKVTGYGDAPEKVAAGFQEAGAPRLHVVDLDAARGGGNNRDTVRNIRREFGGVIEVGGGIREPGDVEELLDAGADRLIVGTVLARDPDKVAGWVGSFGRVFIAGIDARGGVVKVSGWEKDSGLTALKLAKKAREIGMVSIVYTNIERDGTLSGPDVTGSAAVGDSAQLPVIVSGGVGGMDDLERIYDFRSDSIVGVITGKAVYEGLIDVKAALARFADSGEKLTVGSW